MGNGWIKLHRKLLESVVFGNEKGLKVWIWCLLKAGHTQKDILIGRQRITLKPGQFIMGSTTAKESLNLAKATIWYWLNFLESEGQVRLQRTTKYTIVSLPNWDSHQSNLDTDETQGGRWVGTNKNDKKEKNILADETPAEEITESFFEEGLGREPSNRRSKEKLEIYHLFSEREQPWWRHAQQKKAALTLYDLLGVQKVQAGVEFMKEHADDKFCPQAQTPFQYEEALPKLSAYRKRNGL